MKRIVGLHKQPSIVLSATHQPISREVRCRRPPSVASTPATRGRGGASFATRTSWTMWCAGGVLDPANKIRSGFFCFVPPGRMKLNEVNELNELNEYGAQGGPPSLQPPPIGCLPMCCTTCELVPPPRPPFCFPKGFDPGSNFFVGAFGAGGILPREACWWLGDLNLCQAFRHSPAEG